MFLTLDEDRRGGGLPGCETAPCVLGSEYTLPSWSFWAIGSEEEESGVIRVEW